MSDGGFDFRAPEKREKRAFEIPPWEQEAFEKLRATQEEQSETDGAPQGSGQPEDEQVEQKDTLPSPGGVDWIEEVTDTTGETPKGAVDEAMVNAMLATLAAEGKRESSGVWKATMVSGFILAGTGLMLFVWGVAALFSTNRTGKVGLTGGIALIAVGVTFLITAGYLLMKTLRDRGVL